MQPLHPGYFHLAISIHTFKVPSCLFMEKEMATHSSVLAWRIPGTGSLVGCRLWGRTESDMTERLSSSSSMSFYDLIMDFFVLVNTIALHGFVYPFTY